MSTSPQPEFSPAQGRLCVLLAALMWSTSGAYTKILTMPTWFGVHEPAIEAYHAGGHDFPVQIACYRVLFGAVALAPLLSKADLTIRPIMFVMAGLFAAMNILFVSAMALGTAANAILLQYSAPLWMTLASVFWLGEPVDRRGNVTLVFGLIGIIVIVAGGWTEGELSVILIGLASGLTYAGVIVCLRVLRGVSALWVTVWNQGWAALLLLPVVVSLKPPTWTQFAVLFFFGLTQMSLAYWLMARALKSVSPQEAGTLSLFEPLLNPVWTYLVAGEIPGVWTFLGGGIILAALTWRYWPRRVMVA